MDYRGYIEVTEIDPRLLVQVAYSGSRPQGLGFLHHKPGGLDEATLDAIIKRSEDERRKGEIHLDYLNGRSMKFHVMADADTGKRYIDLDWYDHSRESTKHLVRECGLPDVEARIAQAETDKDEMQREYEERQEKAAKHFVAMVIERGGKVTHQTPPFDKYFLLPDGDPAGEAWMYGRTKAVKNGWIKSDREWSTYEITEAGRALMAAA